MPARLVVPGVLAVGRRHRIPADRAHAEPRTVHVLRRGVRASIFADWVTTIDDWKMDAFLVRRDALLASRASEVGVTLPETAFASWELPTLRAATLGLPIVAMPEADQRALRATGAQTTLLGGYRVSSALFWGPSDPPVETSSEYYAPADDARPDRIARALENEHWIDRTLDAARADLDETSVRAAVALAALALDETQARDAEAWASRAIARAERDEPEARAILAAIDAAVGDDVSVPRYGVARRVRLVALDRDPKRTGPEHVPEYDVWHVQDASDGDIEEAPYDLDPSPLFTRVRATRDPDDTSHVPRAPQPAPSGWRWRLIALVVLTLLLGLWLRSR